MSRSGPPREAIIPADPGPVDDDEELCEDCPDARPEPAVYRVPDIRSDLPLVTPLCAYHLRVLAHEEPMLWAELKQRSEVDGLERAAAHEHVLVDLADLPGELPYEGTLYERLGLDETGQAYFVAEAGTHAEVLQTDEQFDGGEPAEIPHEAFRGFLEHIDETAGWRGLESEWIAVATRWSQ